MSNENNWHYYDPANHSQAGVDEVNCFPGEISIPIGQNKYSNNAIMGARNARNKNQVINKLPIMDQKVEDEKNPEVEDEKNQEEVEDEKSEQNDNSHINQVATYKRDELPQPQNAQQPLDEYTRLNRLEFLFRDIGDEYYQEQIKQINLDSPGVKVLENWIKTGYMPEQANITYCDLCEFVIKAENDQYIRTHPELNLPKDTNDTFNRGTSLWFRSKQKKRANYLYELIEGDIEATKNKKITIRDTNRAKTKDKDKRALERLLLKSYLNQTYGINKQNPLNSLKNSLDKYQAGCCC